MTVPPLPTGFNIAAATDTAEAIMLLNSRISRGSYLTLERVGNTTFQPAPTIEGMNLMEDHTAVHADGSPVMNVFITVWLGGKSGTGNVGMTGIVVDLHDEVSIFLNRPSN